jgi:OOP family OmpA-OmpF porin
MDTARVHFRTRVAAAHAPWLIALASTWGLAAADVPQPAASDTFTTETVVAPGRDSMSILAGDALPPRSLGTTGQGFTASVIYQHALQRHLAVELNVQGSTFETGRYAGTDYYQFGATGDLMYRFSSAPDPILSPFVLAGIGGMYDDLYPNSRDGAAYVAEAGAGVATRLLFGHRIRLRFDARWVHDGKQGGVNEYRLLAGFQIPLGGVERVVEHHTIELPSRVEIRETHVVREVERPWIDSDGDGVDDAHDLCPNTPHGLRVDSTGCVIEAQSIELRDVTFDFNQARLTLNAEAVLDHLARAFTGQPSLHAEVAGHTDSVGSESANLALSQRRAEAVVAYLIGRGVQPDQLTARGYGKSKPLVVPETSDRDRERNRRVELLIKTL